MKTMRRFLLCMVAVGLVSPWLRAQEKAPVIPLKLTVVFTEYQGAKKISSLPYTMQLVTGEHMQGPSVRMGLRVPVREGQMMSGQQPAIAEVTEYQDVGTSIDCSVHPRDNGQFAVWVSAERNSVYEPGSQERPEGLAWHPGSSAPTEKPVFSGFRAREEWLMRDGQTVEAVAATDPITGRVTKMEVTLNVLK